jgi:hypothetical protein
MHCGRFLKIWFGGQDRLASRIVNLCGINNGARLFKRLRLKYYLLYESRLIRFP